jgi:DNA invertase Pin-like site-specific DNA recombinase
MSNCIIYTRSNSREDADKIQDTEEQLEHCRNYAHSHGMTIVGEFKDFASANENLLLKNGLLDAFVTLKEGDILLVSHSDRVARKEIEHYLLRAHLQKRGCKLVVVTAVSGDEQVLMDEIIANVNAYFSPIEKE